MKKVIIINRLILLTLFLFSLQVYAQSQGKIIFTKNREIHSVNTDGSGLKQLTDFRVPGHTPICLSASVTKEGKIAFIYDPINHGYMSTYIMNKEGANVKRISKEPKSGKYSTWGTTVSPDGNYYVFESNRTNNVEIYRMNADGSNTVNISKTKNDDAFPKWSPDGKQIIFTSKNPKGGWDVIRVNVDGNERKTLVHSDQEIRNVAYSKDGKLIAYCLAKSNSSDLMLANADGSNVRKLKTIAQYSNVSFSPDSKSITFVSQNNKIAIMKLNGTGYKEFTTGRRPVWSFD